MNFLLRAGFIVHLAALPAVDVRDVQIPSFDKSPLAATYYNPGLPGPGVVIFRNCDQTRTSVDGFARKLAQRGAHVVVYDYRGGLAEGRSWRETRNGDADRVHAWLSSMPGVDRTRLAAVGGSCGVALTLDFAAKHADQIRGIVVLSGPGDSAQRAFIARSPRIGVLGATSDGDGPGGVANVEPIVKASSSKASRMFVLPTGHGMDILKANTAFEKTALDFLGAQLSLSHRE